VRSMGTFRPTDPAFAATQPATVPASVRRILVGTSGAVGAAPSFGVCACLRRELSGEPDAGNLHLRFDEGRAGRAVGVAPSPTLPARLPSRGRSEPTYIRRPVAVDPVPVDPVAVDIVEPPVPAVIVCSVCCGVAFTLSTSCHVPLFR